MYPHFIKAAMERHGGGMEKIDAYPGEITFLPQGPRAMIGAYHAFLAGGSLRRLACRTRPYELEPGLTNRRVGEALAVLVDAFERNTSKETAFSEAFEPFRMIPASPRNRPKVAVFGDFYARDNDVFNQGLEAMIESQGGEVITTPYIDYIKATLDAMFKRMMIDREYGEWAKFKAAVAVIAAVENALSIRHRHAFGRPASWRNPGSLEKLQRLGLRPDHEGECFDNALKIFRVLDENPDVAFFVQTNPAFCCPSIVTEAMARELESMTGVPIVSIAYDGAGAARNDAIIPYLAFGQTKERSLQ
jgi:predicted nucleotide-binding protein (sugar kinase/HSP70/actin superfamily)